MRPAFRAFAYSLLFVAPLTHSADADLITDGYFNALTYSGSKTLTTLYGQFGTGTGSTLTLANWTTTGYNFVYAPGTADAGNKTTGANASQPNEAPGQYNIGSGYGSTYLWGTNNSGTNTITSYPGQGTTGNFLAADGAFEVGAITQTINGLVAGKSYALSFYWAAAQQESYLGDTTENWQVTLGGQSFTTPTYNLTAKHFSGWMQQTFIYTATTATETLSFLAQGTPTGQPPFVLLGGVALDLVPEPSAWMLLTVSGAAFTVMGMVVRRRRAA